ncbi:MAG: hypothetical protein DHS20C19_21060 [Acidimicrobiales bacterium]|nr:MAG: hypothetical protein DHS20C19_21060 [Acidimicrobiales bacterium]
MTALWDVSTDQGVGLSADEFVDVLSTHHDRVVGAWQALTPEQWAAPSRNTAWSAHDTVRHVADAMEMGAAAVAGDPAPFTLGVFDPNSTPDLWLAESAADAPSRTVERYAGAAQRLRAGVGERMAAGDSSTGMTVYGPAHWTVNVVHIFWDSWLHERDVLLPLGLAAESTSEEQRVAALYGLLMAAVPARMMEQPFAATIDFTGSGGRFVTAVHEAGVVSSTESNRSDTDLGGDLCSIVDALAGRGATLDELLPGAPDMLRSFAQFLAG